MRAVNFSIAPWPEILTQYLKDYFYTPYIAQKYFFMILSCFSKLSRKEFLKNSKNRLSHGQQTSKNRTLKKNALHRQVFEPWTFIFCILTDSNSLIKRRHVNFMNQIILVFYSSFWNFGGNFILLCKSCGPTTSDGTFLAFFKNVFIIPNFSLRM